MKMHIEGASHIDDVANQAHENRLGSKLNDAGSTQELKDVDDDALLRAQGHDLVMDRQFNWLAALGLAFSITNSWIGYLVSTTSLRLFHELTIGVELFRAEFEVLRTPVLHLWSYRGLCSAMDCYRRAK